MILLKRVFDSFANLFSGAPPASPISMTSWDFNYIDRQMREHTKFWLQAVDSGIKSRSVRDLNGHKHVSIVVPPGTPAKDIEFSRHVFLSAAADCGLNVHPDHVVHHAPKPKPQAGRFIRPDQFW